MGDIHPYLGGLLLLAFIIIDAVLYAFSSALQNVNDSFIEKKREDDNDRKAKKLERLADNPAVLSNALDITVFISNVAVGGYILRAISRAIEKAAKVQSMWIIFAVAVVVIILLLVVGVLVPKRVGMKFPEKTLYRLVKPAGLFIYVLTPVAFVVTKLSNLVLRLIGINPHEKLENVTEEEIITMVNEGQEKGVLEEGEAKMINNIFEFGDKEAHDVMVHRSNIVGIDQNVSLEEAFKIMLSNNFSRYPVYDEDIDHIVGMIHLRDAIVAYENDKSNEPAIKDINKLMRDAYFVPETRNVDALFKEMQANKIQFAIVVDEYGQTSGIITMEDIIEEIVGNIMDEYDEEEKQIERTSEDSYEVDGLTLLDDLEDLLDITFDTEDYETVNGFMIAQLHRLPADDESGEVDYGGYHFKVLEAKNRVIRKVRITKLEGEEDKSNDDNTQTDE